MKKLTEILNHLKDILKNHPVSKELSEKFDDLKNHPVIKELPDKIEVPKVHPVLRTVMLLIIAASLILGGVGIVYTLGVVTQSPALDPKDFVAQDSSKIYDVNGELVADVGVQLRENITYDQLSQITIDAFVAVEDSRFFEHNGFDVPRFTKAMFENLKTLSFGQGGSTFTMQLVKGTYFETEDALAPRKGLAGVNRKIQEIYLALEAEKIIDKQRILELYLNRINFGVPGNRRGIQTAAQYYFGKTVSDLNLLESAMLAGVINAPNAYNPMRNLDLAKERTDVVLDLMTYHGYITKEEAALAKSIPLENLLVGVVKSADAPKMPYQAYVDTVIKEVIALTGDDPVEVSMKIYTSMDKSLQESVEAIQNGNNPNVVWPNDIIQNAIVTMDNRTGEILAVGGGRAYEGERLFNRATDMKRQPGSSAKLILTYPLAFEYVGWSTQHILEDKPIIYAGTEVVIKNFDDVYRGDVTLASAIGNSLNIPAIETMTAVVNKIGVKKTVAYLNSLGFTDVTSANFDLGYGIGGSTFKASPLQMAGAYSAMINAGNYIQPHTVLRIEYADGSEPLTPTYTATPVLSKEAAYIDVAMMEQDVSGPYRNFMQILKRSFPVYAKTGTSDWGETGVEFGVPSGAAKDKWMIASTSEYTTAVWVGYDKAVKDQISYLTQQQINLNLPGKVNNAILSALYKTRKAPAAVVRPKDVVDLTHVRGIYPYVAVSESTPAELITTGLVKKEFATLQTLDVPVATAAAKTLYNAASISGQLKGYDPYYGYVYYSIVDYPAHGTLELTDAATGAFTYTHSGDGQDDSFTFSVNNGSVTSSPARITITLLPQPTTP